VGIDVSITGAAALRRVAAQVRASGDKGLGREMSRGLQRAAKPVQAAIRREYLKLPVAGGYAGVFSKSVRFRTAVRTGARTASFRLLTYADGAHQRRDIDAVEAGRLRHPVYGRTRAGRAGRRTSNPWAVQAIAGGYHRRGTDSAADEAESEMAKVLDDLSSRLTS
jgi:hypothetical protein